MRYRQLGRSGLFVSEICLGAMTFGGEAGAGIWKAIGGLNQNEVNSIIGKALDAGVNFIDTADVYSFGQSEQRVGQALKDIGVPRKDVVIATKVFGEMGPGPNDRGASRGHIMDSVYGSLERLQTDHIDLYQIHGNDTVTPIDETLRALDDLTGVVLAVEPGGDDRFPALLSDVVPWYSKWGGRPPTGYGLRRVDLDWLKVEAVFADQRGRLDGWTRELPSRLADLVRRAQDVPVQ